MYRCPKCNKDFKSAEELNEHFNQNYECRWYAKRLMYSKSLLATLDPNKRIDVFLKTYANKPLLIRFAREG